MRQQHRASFRAGPSGTWLGGCVVCGVGFSGETSEVAAQAWCSGHDAAVARARHVAAHHPPFFAPTGPGDAITVSQLRHVLDVAAANVGHGAEILQPADQVPWLYLWTPPLGDGWRRGRLGGIYLERSGEFVPEPSPEAWAG